MAAPLKFGQEFQVNVATVGGQDTPAIAALANGKFVVVWEDGGAGLGNDVKARVYNADGSAASGEILVNQTTLGEQGNPVVAALADGRFVVAFEDSSSSQNEIKARVFGNDGVADATVNSGNAFTVSDPSDVGGKTDAAIAGLTGGGFVIAYAYNILDSGNHEINGRAYDAAGLSLATGFTAFATSADETNPSVAGLSNGTYVVAATRDSGTDDDIYARILFGKGITAPGTPAEFILSDSAGSASQASLAAFANGGFIATFATTANQSIHGRVYSSTGSGAGNPEFGVSGAGAPAETDPSVAVLRDGSYVVVWVDPGNSDGSGTHIRGEIFSGTNGASKSGEFRINTLSSGDQIQAGVAALADGRFVVTWVDPGQTPGGPDVDGNSIRAQIFDPRTAPLGIVGTPLGDDFVGTAFDDAMDGAAGNDRLNGRDGKDTLFGDSGADAFVFDVKPSKKGNVDTIADFASGSDTIVLDASVYKKLKLGALKAKAFYAHKNADEAKDGKDRIVYDTKSGETWWDKDGKGGAKAKLFAILDDSPKIEAGDFVVVA